MAVNTMAFERGAGGRSHAIALFSKYRSLAVVFAVGSSPVTSVYDRHALTHIKLKALLLAFPFREGFNLLLM